MHLLRRWIDRLVDACTVRIVGDDGTPLVVVCDPYGLTTLVADAPGCWDTPEITDEQWYLLERTDW